MKYEIAQEIVMTTECCCPSCRHVEMVTDTAVGTTVHQQFTTQYVTMLNCAQQRRPHMLIRLVNTAATVNEQMHYIVVSSMRSQ